jgi:outer membrane lipoprotein-sorting protein
MNRKMNPVFILAVLFAASFRLTAESASTNGPSAAEILARVDANETYASIIYEGEMIIEYQSRRYVKNFTAWTRANRDSFIEFTNREDRGTKYLKKDGRLYVYSPDTEQVMLISGHLLKESMMGSDLSYEDTVENVTLSERYAPAVSGSGEMNGRSVWILDLTAVKKTESYPAQRLFVAKDNFDLVRSEYFALSGAKLKEYNLVRSEKIGNRYFPMESEMRDLLRKGSRTVFKMSAVQLDAKIDDSVFNSRNLK